jgi:hypothetical protein
VTTFFNLIRCAVPLPLKADILLTLASLAKTAEVANEIWQTMEATNIICTTPATSTYQPKGLQVNKVSLKKLLFFVPFCNIVAKI